MSWIDIYDSWTTEILAYKQQHTKWSHLFTRLSQKTWPAKREIIMTTIYLPLHNRNKNIEFISYGSFLFVVVVVVMTMLIRCMLFLHYILAIDGDFTFLSIWREQVDWKVNDYAMQSLDKLACVWIHFHYNF